MTTPEGKVKKEIKEWLDGMGAYWFMPVQSGYGINGTPDLICCLHGRFLGIETKAPGKKPNPWQEREIARIRKAGGVAFWCASLQEAKEAMMANGWVL